MKIYIEPCGGLCNRMRVIASAYAFMKPRNGKVIVKWVANNELNCSSKALFSLPSGISVLNLSDATPMSRLWMKAAYYWLRLGYRNRMNDDSVRDAKEQGDILLEDKTYYETCETFQKDSRGIDCRIFTPNPVLLERANTKIHQISEDGKHRIIGVHIRRTDNCVSIQDSPTELFCRILDTHLRKDPAVRFYIATDDPSLRLFFREKYNTQKEVVFFNDSDALRRDTAEGIKAAYVELLTLSMTERIYGSSGSSYSEVAAALGNLPLEIAHVDTIEDSLRTINGSH